MATPNFGAPDILGDQAQKHATANDAHWMLDAAIPQVVVSASTVVPPASPIEGERYIVPSGATFGAASVGDIVIWRKNAWHAITPQAGWRWLVADQGREYIFTAAGWMPGSVSGPNTGAAMGLQVVDTTLTLAGASVSALGLIPPRAIVLGVTSWVIGAVTGATAFRVGDTSSDSRFGSALGLAVGSSNIGVVGPFATYSADDVVVTAEGPVFTGGEVGIAVSLIMPPVAPI